MSDKSKTTRRDDPRNTAPSVTRPTPPKMAGELVRLEPNELDNGRWQSRYAGSDLHIDSLMEDIAANGQSQPVLAMRGKSDGDRPIVLDGHRRVSAIETLTKDGRWFDGVLVLLIPYEPDEARVATLAESNAKALFGEADRVAAVLSILRTFGRTASPTLFPLLCSTWPIRGKAKQERDEALRRGDKTAARRAEVAYYKGRIDRFEAIARLPAEGRDAFLAHVNGENGLSQSEAVKLAQSYKGMTTAEIAADGGWQERFAAALAATADTSRKAKAERDGNGGNGNGTHRLSTLPLESLSLTAILKAYSGKTRSAEFFRWLTELDQALSKAEDKERIKAFL